MQIGRKLKDLRLRLKLTQKQMAQKVIRKKIDYTYIGKIERGEQNPSLNILQRICESFNINLEYFFTDNPLSMYLKGEKENNTKRQEILDLLYSFSKEELEFLIKIMYFLNKHKKLQSDTKVLKAAQKRSRYKKKSR